jgi:hypothetical protein
MMSWAIHNVDFLTGTFSHVTAVINNDSIATLVPNDGHIVLANQFNQDILGDLTKAFNKFVKSGQLLAMAIGFVIGYIFKSITSYG